MEQMHCHPNEKMTIRTTSYGILDPPGSFLFDQLLNAFTEIEISVMIIMHRSEWLTVYSDSS